MIHHQDDWLTIHVGDCRAVLAELEAESVNCVVTSPPYFGLRDYGVEGQLGLEPTPEAYIAAMVDVFREIRRVLRKDGTVWLNLGDSYANDGKWGGHTGGKHVKALHDSPIGRNKKYTGHKPKDRMMMPARVAIALQEDGWWLRDEIVWAKPNPMPSSVADRTTPAHEMVYLLTKSARYAYDADAIREPIAASSIQRINQASFDAQTGGPKDYANGTNANRSARKGLENFAKGRRTPAGWNVNHDQPNIVGRFDQRRDKTADNPNARGLRHAPEPGEANAFHPLGRNKRSVWTIATQPYPEAHFATFPEALVEPMILAGCPERVCSECGAPWQRIVERTPNPSKWANVGQDMTGGAAITGNAQTSKGLHRNGGNAEGPRPVTRGWAPTCAHASSRPGTVLDPFGGSGTVAVVANRLGRKAVLVDLSTEYAAQMLRRVAASRSSGEGPAVDVPLPFPDDGLWGEASA